MDEADLDDLVFDLECALEHYDLVLAAPAKRYRQIVRSIRGYLAYNGWRFESSERRWLILFCPRPGYSFLLRELDVSFAVTEKEAANVVRRLHHRQGQRTFVTLAQNDFPIVPLVPGVLEGWERRLQLLMK